MLSRLRPRLTFANVTSCAALFVALGGSSYAAVTISNSSQIKNNTIQGIDVANGSLTSDDIKNKSLKEQDMGTAQVSSRAIRDDAVTQKEIAANAVTAEAVKKASLTAAEIQKASLTADLFAPGQIPAGRDGTDGKKGDVGPTAGAVNAGAAEGNLSAVAPSATTNVTVPTQSKLLIQAVDNYVASCGPGPNGAAAIGLYIDGVFVPGSRRDIAAVDNDTTRGVLVTIGAASNVAAGTHAVSVRSTPGCGGSSGLNALVSAIALGG